MTDPTMRGAPVNVLRSAEGNTGVQSLGPAAHRAPATSDQIVAAIVADPADGFGRGTIMGLEHSTPSGSAEGGLARQLIARAQPRPTGPGTFSAPANPVFSASQSGLAMFEANRRAGVEQPRLGASDLAWIERLPADPAAVPLEDARRIVTMAVTHSADEGDARLLRSIAGPISRHHEIEHARAVLDHRQRLAEQTKASARAVVLALTTTAADPPGLGLLAERVYAESPQLDPAQRVAAGRDRVISMDEARDVAKARLLAAAHARAEQADRSLEYPARRLRELTAAD